MSVRLFRFSSDDIYDDNALIDYSKKVSSDRIFNEHWSRAAVYTNSRLFRERSDFGVDDLDQVLDELQRQKEWALKNITGRDVFYMVDRIEELLDEIPKICKENSHRFYIF